MWEESIILTGHFAPVTDLDTSSRGYVVTCSDDQTTRLWAKWLRNDTWHEVARPQVHGYDINTV
jgi:elongator complex protein 2